MPSPGRTLTRVKCTAPGPTTLVEATLGSVSRLRFRRAPAALTPRTVRRRRSLRVECVLATTTVAWSTATSRVATLVFIACAFAFLVSQVRICFQQPLLLRASYAPQLTRDRFLGAFRSGIFFLPTPRAASGSGFASTYLWLPGCGPTEHRDRHRAEHSGTDADWSARAASLRQVRGLRSPYTTYCDRN